VDEVPCALFEASPPLLLASGSSGEAFIIVPPPPCVIVRDGRQRSGTGGGWRTRCHVHFLSVLRVDIFYI
jgi:hypothetical protein